MKKKVIFALAMAAMMITGCSNSDSSSKDRTTTTTNLGPFYSKLAAFFCGVGEKFREFQIV